jgi:peptide/nickel transport system permease protein
MIRRVLLRCLAAIPITFGASALVFLLLQLAPADPAVLLTDPQGSKEANEAQRRLLGLDRPLGEQFARWMGATATLDFGRSFADGRSVREKIVEALPHTLLLSGASLVLGLAAGLGAALLCAWRPRSALDLALAGGSLFLSSIPIFWLAFLAVEWGWFPAGDVLSSDAKNTPGLHLLDRLHHLALPALLLAAYLGSSVARYARAALLDTLSQDFILAARARGASTGRVLWRHALPASLHTTIALLGLWVPFLVAGAVLVEWVFNWPGMGQLLVGAMKHKDYPVVCAAVVAVSWLSVLGNLLAEAVAGALDPRVEE